MYCYFIIKLSSIFSWKIHQYSKACLIWHLSNPFPCVIQHIDFNALLTIFYLFYNVLSNTLSIPTQNLSPSACQIRQFPLYIHFDTGQSDLALSSRIRQTVDGLIISNTRLSDAGLYRCLSMNGAGTAQSSGELTIQGRNNPHLLLDRILKLWRKMNRMNNPTYFSTGI